MKTQTCRNCNKELELNTKNFRKYISKNNNFEPGLQYHSICRNCENETQYNNEWRDGLLKCHICGNYYPETEFHINNNKPIRNNRDRRCGKCKVLQSKKHRGKLSDSEKLNKMLLSRLLGAKDRARRNNINFDVTFEDLKNLWDKQHGLCSLSGIPMTYIFDNGRIPTNLSIDRINNKEGYVKNNIQLVCMAVNQMKSDLSMSELIYFCKSIINNQK